MFYSLRSICPNFCSIWTFYLFHMSQVLFHLELVPIGTCSIWHKFSGLSVTLYGDVSAFLQFADGFPDVRGRHRHVLRQTFVPCPANPILL